MPGGTGTKSKRCREFQWVFQKPLPKADTNRFAVAIAHLQNDVGNEYERLIVEELKQFPGVQPLQFDRLISLSSGGTPEQEESAGHDIARKYLDETKADALIWGMIHHINNQSALRLFWTSSTEKKKTERVFELENFQLPELFWKEFREVRQP